VTAKVSPSTLPLIQFFISTTSRFSKATNRQPATSAAWSPPLCENLLYIMA
jgi:hypothetical protein